MNIKRKIVITGGPCSGKTTLIEKLAEIGHIIVQEAATQIISEGIFHPLKNPLIFQQKVVNKQISLEKKAESKTGGLIFCDRGIYDGLAYLKFFNVAESQLQLPEKWNYLIAFHLSQLPYKKDQIRFESPEEAMKISQLIKEAYIEKNVILIDVPVINIEQRTKFVLQELDKFTDIPVVSSASSCINHHQ